ncbi:MAG: hypothetical protein Q9210_000497 [Variospora velana]
MDRDKQRGHQSSQDYQIRLSIYRPDDDILLYGGKDGWPVARQGQASIQLGVSTNSLCKEYRYRLTLPISEYNPRNPPGSMLTRYQDSIRNSLHPRILQTVRIVQFVSAVISIILYIVYVARQARTSRGDGAVLGILAGGIVFSAIALAKACIAKGKVAALVLLFLIIDLLFVAAYIGVAVLTGGDVMGSSCRFLGGEDSDGGVRASISTNCNLEMGVFSLAIINIIQHIIASAVEHYHNPPKIIKCADRSGYLIG